MRALLDSNGVDPLIDLPGALAAVEAAVSRGELELLISPAAVAELHQTPRDDRRCRLVDASNRANLVPDGAVVFNRSKFDLMRFGDADIFEALRSGNDKHINDALIAMSARGEGAILVTNEVKQLTNRATKVGLTCITTADLLRRIGFAPPSDQPAA